MTAIYLVQLVAATDAAGTTTTLRYGTQGFTTGPADTPANTFFEPRIKQPGNLTRDMFASGTTGGPARPGYGELVLANADGGLDALIAYGFDGRVCTLYVGDDSATFPSGFTVVMTGTMEQPEFGMTEMTIRLRDRLAELDLPVCQTRYGGTNSLPNGLDGVGDDWKGKAIPKLYGTVYNIAPPQVNTSKLTYQVNAGAVNAIPAVYDRGVAITPGADYATNALLQAAAPGAGTFITCIAEGFFRLGTAATGTLTCDATEGANAAARSTAQILKRIATDRGLAAGDVTGADVTALDTANAAEVGIWINDDTAALSAMSEIAASIGAWFGFDRLGKLRMARLIAPAGTPAAEFYDWQILDMERQASRDESNGLPVWRVTIGGEKNHTVQATDLAGAVTQARRGWLASALRTVTAEDAAIKTQFLLAAELVRNTLLILQSAIATEVARVLALFKVRRDLFRFRVRTDAATAAAVDLGGVVKVYYSRWSLSAGKLFVVLGITADYAKNELTLTLWG